MKNLEFSFEDVGAYYNGHFAHDLRCYFEIEGPCAYRDYSMVLFMDRVKRFAGSPAECAMFGGTCCDPHNLVFAGIVLHMILISQSLRAVIGNSAAEDFHRASGWPLFSAGMAGPDHDAMKMIGEAYLAPAPEEVDHFKKMMQVVSPYMEGELRRFLTGEAPANINAVAYQRLTKIVSGRVDEVIDWISLRMEMFLKRARRERLMSSLPVSLLKHVLSIPSVTNREERMRDYISRFASSRDFLFATDEIGNVYLTKGRIKPDEYVPCFVNHMDTVQDGQSYYVNLCKRLPIKERKNKDGQSELYVDGFGIGGDNKAGCAIALALMASLPKCKAVFFVQEETGCIGASYMNYAFLSNVSLLITMDCWGRVRTASEWCENGAKMYSQEFYDTVLKDVFDRHGVTVRDHQANTDICHLMMNCDLCCCDISNGSYNPHDSDEYVCVEDAKASYKLILDLCRHLDPHRAYRITEEERGGIPMIKRMSELIK